jgi:hypothetical protein
MRGGHVVVSEVGCERVAIDVSPPRWMNSQRLELGRKEEGFSSPAVIQRLFAHAIACKMQRILVAIPKGEGKHAIESAQSALDAPMFECRQGDFRVGVAPPRETVQISSQQLEVVNLTIECDDIASGGGAHRLMSLGGEIDDRQTSMPECDAAARVGPRPSVIGAPMLQGIGHPLDQAGHTLSRDHRRRLNESC